MDIFKSLLVDTIESSDSQGVQYAIVADASDPLGLQRVRVYDSSKGGQYVSDWLLRVLPYTSYSPPIPKVGELVLISYILGDPHKGVYLGLVVNSNNRPVGGDDSLTVSLGGATVSITANGDVSVETTGKATIKAQDIQAEATGSIKLKAATLEVDCPDVSYVNTTSFKVAGKQVVTLLGRDSNNDTIVVKGW